MAEFRWTDREFMERVVVPSAQAGLVVAAEVLAARMILNMGSEGGGVVGKTSTGRNIYAPSPPGAFPGVRRGGGGGLTSAIGYTPPEGLTISVGADSRAPHGYFLEVGTSTMAARPWAMRSFRESAPALNKAFRAGMRAEFTRRVGGRL